MDATQYVIPQTLILVYGFAFNILLIAVLYYLVVTKREKLMDSMHLSSTMLLGASMILSTMCVATSVVDMQLLIQIGYISYTSLHILLSAQIMFMCSGLAYIIPRIYYPLAASRR